MPMSLFLTKGPMYQIYRCIPLVKATSVSFIFSCKICYWNSSAVFVSMVCCFF
uniref:Uncharacterized protein n=1 Tax=Anguilla anguilla TaxID=7936 RepID=A0A0E9W4T3_ANGAN